MITVAAYTDPLQAHLARGRLQAEGIQAEVVHEHHVWANWALSNALGGVKLQVAEADAERARTVLGELAEGAFELDEPEADRPRCPRCGGLTGSELKMRWRVAMVGFFLFSLPLPFRRREYQCIDCGQRWRGRDDED
ncbi:hypothetical protein B5T_00858 [Alloalcanivorax dieselolei B5]|uniref:DUF2007 domain-containing protein n=1 Tax=Alcanivorax dieselolei (strain DSM 16502 / CGMCC 1.3690 / MCCC 1A00001 / B-5) TaxID=930169 RepID=K0CBV8_ALCDB|nr:DUF2007 domain-containing protein [Alloalcanivorax dieselolei]AFT69142.1 hypothetical protein B5T_00858 [Alloalcanivorax dieselolei B5]GGJ82833.1 hypothetical protein GCM10007426_09920 [Alloalcanivorax dieselolei]